MITVREYGAAKHGLGGPLVLTLHGGPGAPGSISPVARGLADRFRVLEPLQRGAGDVPLTVAQHVADLDEVIRDRAGDAPPALVGASWGAMLALAYAAEHPDRAGPIVLVGGGTWDKVARGTLQQIIRDRMGEEDAVRLETLDEDYPDPAERMEALGDLILPVFAFDADPDLKSDDAFDAEGNVETWGDMIRLQEAGAYPAAFSAITTPVLMLHGDYDPHPGRPIRDSLLPVLPQLEYVELANCGHDPWIERQARDEFFAVLADWLSKHPT